MDCGFLLLWFEEKWKNSYWFIVFHEEDDFVVVRYFKDDGKSAIKNYSRSLVPRSALILRRHYENILGVGLAEQITGDSVLRNKQSKAKQYRYQNLIQEAARLINAAARK